MALAAITGASGGIGLCMAHELAARKYDLLLIARSSEKLATECAHLQQKFNVRASYLALDLSVNTSVDEIKKWVESNPVDLEILINNAGYGLWGDVERSEPTGLENMMQLNMNSLVQLCHQMIPILKRRQVSYILNVASTAAYQAVPTLSTYAATKAFVVLFSRGLRWELKDTGISVSCVSPGATSTGFIDRAGMQSLKERAEKFSMKPETVAKIAIDAMFTKKAEIIPGFVNWISVKLTYFLPKYLIEKIAAGLYE
jgi:short-subunit dehydrogenase